jgi:hypothetical protein
MADLNELHIGDWWEIEQGLGLSCRYAKIVAFTDNETVAIKCIDEERHSTDLGFSIKTSIVDPYCLLKKSDLTEEEIKKQYKEIAHNILETRLKELFS